MSSNFNQRDRLKLHGQNDVQIWGMSNATRVSRLMDKLSGDVAGHIWVNLNFIFDPQWLVYLQDNADTVLTMGGVPVAGHILDKAALEKLDALQIPGDLKQVEYTEKPIVYNHNLRKLETPFAERLVTENVRSIERQSYFGAYKGVTDVLTKYLWPELAYILTRIAAKLRMTPNMVTGIGAVGCIAATFLFYYGYFWSGMAAGFVFMVLDTVDGKLARCTITSSWWGNIFDHGLDLIHPPFWWVAWAIGLGAVNLALPPDQFRFAMIAILGGYVLQRVLEGIFIAAFGQHMHVWRRFDSWFRLITARRNPNMLLLFGFTVFGRPDMGLLVVAWWTIISLMVHVVQLFQAMVTRMRGQEVSSWLEDKKEVTA